MSEFKETERRRRFELEARASRLLRGCPWAENLLPQVILRLERGDSAEDTRTWIEAKTAEYRLINRETIKVHFDSRRNKGTP